MTDNDFRIEDRKEREAKRPNYPLRRVKFLLAVVGLVASVTLMLTWHGGSLAGALVVEGVYLATALWLVVHPLRRIPKPRPPHFAEDMEPGDRHRPRPAPPRRTRVHHADETPHPA